MATEGGPVWVGLLDLDDDGQVVGMSGPIRPDHSQARVLVRLHGACVGFVRVPTSPSETLMARVQAAAEKTLAEGLRRHAEWDKEAEEKKGSMAWTARVACPRRFPVNASAGVTVLICTRNRPKMLADCLRTLRQVAYTPLEILIVDNAPNGDDTKQIVTRFAQEDPRISYTCEPRPGKSLALNHGLAKAKFEIVAITDDDTLIDPGWLAAIAAGFAADPETVCVTGPVISSALETGSERYFEARYPWGEKFEPRRYDLARNRHPSRMYPFTAGLFGTGANCAVRRSYLIKLGGFDTLLGAGGPRRGGADLDMFLRIILAGGRISYVPSALIWHRHRADTRALAGQLYAYGHGLGAYVAKHLHNSEFREALLADGFRKANALRGRQRLASKSSELGIEARRLALYEVGGLMPGAFRYWLAARRSSASAGRAR